MLSTAEVLALANILEAAIVKSRDEDSGDPVLQEVEIGEINPSPFSDVRARSALYSVLAKKGFIECSGTEDDHGNEILEYVCITQSGLDALKAAQSVH